MTRPLLRTLGLTGALALAPSLAFAHVGVGDAHGFLHGFMHPMTGLDHVLAMVTVGIFAWQLGGRAVWLVPATFVLLMAAGGALGMSGFTLPYVELGIALSVVVLGATVAMGVQLPLAAAMALVGAFAVFHGHAHGAEMPETASGLAYGAGFMLATAALHLSGLAMGAGIGRFGDSYGQAWVRRAGAAVSVAGLGLVLGAL